MATETASPAGSLEVPPDEIERALKKIWKEAAQLDEAADPSPEHTPRLRTTLSNLVITVPPDQNNSRKRIDELITDLCVFYPSRFFIVSVEEGASAEKLITSVSSRCVLGSSGKHVCSEEIYIRAGEKSLPFVASLLRSLFVSDVSIVSLVLGDPTSSEKLKKGGEQKSENPFANLLNELREMCDLFLYDSKDVIGYLQAVSIFFSLRRVVKKKNESPSRELAPSTVRLRDLNWYRLDRFRKLIAEQFEAVDNVNLDRSIERIVFSCSEGEKNSAALLLAGWIVAVLKWTVKSKSGEALQFETPEGRRSSISFATSDNAEDFQVTFITGGTELTISSKDNGASYETKNNRGASRRLSIPIATEAELLISPIQSSGLDDYFTRSLERSLDLARVLAEKC